MRMFPILMTLALAGAGAMKAASAEDELRAMEKRWAAAVMAKDPAALDRIFDAKLIYAHSTGVIETRQQYVGRIKGGAQRYDQVEHEDMKVVSYGDSAVVHSHVRMKGLSDKRPFDDYLMMMHVWVKQAGAWRLVAHQTTKLK